MRLFIYFKHWIVESLCCSVETHLDSNSWSAIAEYSSKCLLGLSLVFFSCSNNFTLSQRSLGSKNNHLVFDPLGFEIRDPAMKTGDLTSLIGDLTVVFLAPTPLSSKLIPFEKWNISFLSCVWELSTLNWQLGIVFKMSAFKSYFLFESQKVNKLSQRVELWFLYQTITTVFDFGPLTSLNWLVFSGLPTFIKGDTRWNAIILLSFFNSKNFRLDPKRLCNSP